MSEEEFLAGSKKEKGRIRAGWRAGVVHAVTEVFAAVALANPGLFYISLVTFGLAWGVRRQNPYCGIFLVLWALCDAAASACTPGASEWGVHFIPLFFVTFYVLAADAIFREGELRRIYWGV